MENYHKRHKRKSNEKFLFCVIVGGKFNLMGNLKAVKAMKLRFTLTLEVLSKLSSVRQEENNFEKSMSDKKNHLMILFVFNFQTFPLHKRNFFHKIRYQRLKPLNK